MLDPKCPGLRGRRAKRDSEQVKRNVGRFPDDFAFVLTKEESKSLRSRIATLKKGRGEHRKYLPRVFTEHGALMAASILSSPKAVDMSIQVVRAFVRLRRFLATHGRASQGGCVADRSARPPLAPPRPRSGRIASPLLVWTFLRWRFRFVHHAQAHPTAAHTLR